MDLVAGVRHVWVITEHVTRDGGPKLLNRCTLPLTGVGVVERVYTNLAVIDVTPSGFLLRERAARVPIETIRRLTGAPLAIASDVREIEPPQL